MSARAIAIHGNEKSGERRANLEIKSECPALLSRNILPRINSMKNEKTKALRTLQLVLQQRHGIIRGFGPFSVAFGQNCTQGKDSYPCFTVEVFTVILQMTNNYINILARFFAITALSNPVSRVRIRHYRVRIRHLLNLQGHVSSLQGSHQGLQLCMVTAGWRQIRNR